MHSCHHIIVRIAVHYPATQLLSYALERLPGSARGAIWRPWLVVLGRACACHHLVLGPLTGRQYASLRIILLIIWFYILLSQRLFLSEVARVDLRPRRAKSCQDRAYNPFAGMTGVFALDGVDSQHTNRRRFLRADNPISGLDWVVFLSWVRLVWGNSLAAAEA